MACNIRFLYGKEENLDYTSFSPGQVLFAVNSIKQTGNIYFDDPFSMERIKLNFIPEPTKEDEGKILQVIDGIPTWE